MGFKKTVDEEDPSVVNCDQNSVSSLLKNLSSWVMRTTLHV
jgi:hypothetical protein